MSSDLLSTAYFVHEEGHNDGITVIAKTQSAAKIIALKSDAEAVKKGNFGHFYDLDNLLVDELPYTNLAGQHSGVVENSKRAVRVGLYPQFFPGDCDLCGKTATLYKDPKEALAICATCYNERRGRL